MLAVLVACSAAPRRPSLRAGGGPRAVTAGRAQPRFRRVVAPMAPWVFAAPGVAFALLPSVVGAQHATDGIALTAAVITALTALAGVLIQPLGASPGRRAPRGNRAATVGLVVVAGGLGLSAFTAHEQQVWLLVPARSCSECAYGLCLVGGLVEVQRLAGPEALAGLTAIYYVLTYLGFAAPYLLALAAGLTSYTTLLLITAGLALLDRGVGQAPGPAGSARLNRPDSAHRSS